MIAKKKLEQENIKWKHLWVKFCWYVFAGGGGNNDDDDDVLK